VPVGVISVYGVMVAPAESHDVVGISLLRWGLGTADDVGVLDGRRTTPADVPVGIASVKADGRFTEPLVGHRTE
jgi:hypothetical protein